MAAYAGQVDSLDQSVGRILDALRQAKVEENTLVMFLSDNGASDQDAARSLDQPGKTWRVDGTPTLVGNKPTIRPGGADTFVTGGPPWSCVSNTPFRHHKQSNHEGGIASPLIVRWPAVVQSKGTLVHEPVHITDLLPTCLNVAQAEYPEKFGKRSVLPLAGRSLVPAFQGKPTGGSRMLYWATSGSRAVRDGDWKLVAYKAGPWELYNLAADRAELNDLAKEHPDRVGQLKRAFEAWQKGSSAPQ
jgi:arylsulfatase